MKKKVLTVDDSRTIRNMLLVTLNNAGFETIQAEAQVIGHDGRAVEWFALRVVERAAFEDARCAGNGAVLALAAGKIGGHGCPSFPVASAARG